MAQKVLVQLVDDLDGTSSDDVSTVSFGIDGAEYEIDLAHRNAERIRNLLADYIASGRRTGGRLKRGTRPGQAGKSSSSDASTIRAWATDNGFDPAGRGRIPAHVVEAYTQARQPNVTLKRRTVAATKNAQRRASARKSR